ncbi:MAG: hypothetical protein HOV80_22290 [Polyangiaceae bacterium]|nr:hypothetical protein [Polyangiaceae bacterium]
MLPRAPRTLMLVGLFAACSPFPGEPVEPDDPLTPEDTPKAGPEPLGRSGKSAEDMTDRSARGLDATTHTAAGSGGAPQMTGTGTTTATGGGGAPPKR